MNKEVGLAESVLLALVIYSGWYAFAWLNPNELTLVLSFVAATLSEPLLVLAHELGHAVAVVLVTGRRARVQAGKPPFAWVFSIGKISVEYAHRGVQGHCRLDRSVPVSGWGLLAIALAGPAANIALGLILSAVAVLSWGAAPNVLCPLIMVALTSLYLGFANLIPEVKVPEWWPGAIESEVTMTDGYLALGALKAGLRSTVLTPPPPLVYTPGAQQALRAAGVAARAGRSRDVDAEHLLVGLSRVERGGASRILRECGFEAPAPGSHADSLPAALTHAARRALERAKTVLSLRGDPLIDTEHMLLGLVEDGDPSVSSALERGGADRAELRRRLLQALAA